jgi:hypothetical protein
MKEKEMSRDRERLYLDKKEMATNKELLKTISPELVMGGGEDMKKDGEKIENEIMRLRTLLS